MSATPEPIDTWSVLAPVILHMLVVDGVEAVTLSLAAPPDGSGHVRLKIIPAQQIHFPATHAGEQQNHEHRTNV